MNRQEYMRQLEVALSRIARAEREDVLEYYNEYFDEAGPEQEQETIKSLGSPQNLASQIKAQCAMRRLENQETPTVKKGISAIWLVVLGIFAAPIALPIAITMAAVVFSLVLVAVCLLIGIIALAIGLFAAGVAVVIFGCTYLITGPATALFFIGLGVALAGGTLLTGVLAVMAAAAFFRFLARSLSKTFSRRKTEQSQKEVLRNE